MGWWIAIAKAGRGAAQSSRFSRLGSLSARISAWLQSTKWSSWLKVGAAGGVGLTIYHGWRSVISSVSDATGLSEGNVETIMFLIIGAAVAYVAARVLIPYAETRSGSGNGGYPNGATFVLQQPASDSDARRVGADSGVRVYDEDPDSYRTHADSRRGRGLSDRGYSGRRDDPYSSDRRDRA